MKPYKPKKEKICKVCLESFMPVRSFESCCCLKCAISYAKAKTTAKVGKDKRKAIKALNESDITWWKKRAKFHCHKYIRERDKDLFCVTCNKPYNSLNRITAGHLKADGSHSFVRYHEDNISGQCIQCNSHKSNADTHLYIAELRRRIGDKRVDWVLENCNNYKKWTIEELKEITKKYREKIKKIEKELM